VDLLCFLDILFVSLLVFILIAETHKSMFHAIDVSGVDILCFKKSMSMQLTYRVCIFYVFYTFCLFVCLFLYYYLSQTEKYMSMRLTYRVYIFYISLNVLFDSSYK